MRAEGDPHVAGAFIGFDSVGPEFGDPNERLGVEKQQDAGDSVGQGLAGACKQFPEPGHALVLGDRGAGFGGVVAHVHSVVCAGVLDEDDEGADGFSGRGTGCEPGFDVLLGAVRRCPLVGFPEPVKELDGLRDLLFGGVHRGLGTLLRCCHGSDAPEVMPGGELRDGFGDLLGQVAELVVNPGLEPGQIRVLVGEESVMNEQGAQVIGFAVR